MRSELLMAALSAALLAAAAAPAVALQCVPYARSESGISIRGDAWTWWNAAEGTYDRGQAPKAGAVLVFKPHGSMRLGHVAVVSKIVNSREVLVDQANWGMGDRGRISTHVAVRDVSAENDWSDVRVWNNQISDYGTSTYPTYGFIYSRRPGHHIDVQSAVFRLSFDLPDEHHSIHRSKTVKSSHKAASHTGAHSIAAHHTTSHRTAAQHTAFRHTEQVHSSAVHEVKLTVEGPTNGRRVIATVHSTPSHAAVSHSTQAHPTHAGRTNHPEVSRAHHQEPARVAKASQHSHAVKHHVTITAKHPLADRTRMAVRTTNHENS